MAFKVLTKGQGWFDQLNDDLQVVRGKSVEVKLTGINGWVVKGCSIVQHDTENWRLINLSGQLTYTGSNVNSGYSGYIAAIPQGNYDHLNWQHGYAMSNGKMGGVVNDGTDKLKLYVPRDSVNNGDNWQVSCTIVQTKN